jgi:putative signal transducing protein
MFCPECRAQYREGFKVCNDCRVALVDELPAEPKPEFHEFVEVITVTSEVRMALIQAALDDAGIDYYLHGEAAHRLVPLPMATRLMVREDQAEEALQLLTEMDLS